MKNLLKNIKVNIFVLDILSVVMILEKVYKGVKNIFTTKNIILKEIEPDVDEKYSIINIAAPSINCR